MLFCGTDLAARIERAESGLVADGARAVERRRPGTGVLVRPIAGGVASYAGVGSPLTKVAGLGFAGAVDEGELAEVERTFAERGAPVQAEVSSLADPAVAELLTRRGYVLKGIENVLGLALDAERARRPLGDVEIAVSGPDELAAWMQVVVDGFLAPDERGVASHESFPREIMEQSLSDMASADGFLRFLARRGGEPAGGAAMRLSEGVAQLCGAATLPAHRRRGVQGALLAHRLRLARERGCDVAVVTTQPGSTSCQNVQRQGFELLYVRCALVREP